jgi:hypothetical protein
VQELGRQTKPRPSPANVVAEGGQIVPSVGFSCPVVRYDGHNPTPYRVHPALTDPPLRQSGASGVPIMKSSAFIAASAAVILFSRPLTLAGHLSRAEAAPARPDLTARMRTVSPAISRETTMWRVWVGFNATHSFGLILFSALRLPRDPSQRILSFTPGSCLHLASHCCLAMQSSRGSIFSLRRFAESRWRRFSTFLESSSTWHSRGPDNCCNTISITTGQNPEPLLCRNHAQIRFSAKGIRAFRQVF